MTFKVYRTKTFEKEFYKLPSSEQKEIEKFERKLSETPYIGKPLGFVFFREKKLGGRRIYYLIYEDFVVALMVAISDKKTQQDTINAIKEKLAEYYEMVKESLKKI